MSETPQPSNYNIGWDVGGWNCDKNPRSRDAIVILDAERCIHGTPWRGNLREKINSANTTDDWIEALFELCGADHPRERLDVVLAIDTPLGFSTEFARLVTSGHPAVGELEESSANPYLFRQTERFLFQNDLTPLSPVKDMIGSQATKGMHVLAKFAPTIASCGVWTDEKSLTVIETYPAACKGSTTMEWLWRKHEPLGNDDKDDALTCALAAYLFFVQGKQPRRFDIDLLDVPPKLVNWRQADPELEEWIRRREAKTEPEHWDALVGPVSGVPESEGWIWVPVDVINMETLLFGGHA